MIGIFKYFDAYTVRARIIPALIAGLPALAFPLVVVHWDHFGLSNAIASIMSIVLLSAGADLARRRGRLVEKKLGTRGTPYLWHRSNSAISNISKDIYRDFIARKIQRAAPTEEDEINTPLTANDFYAAANDWLRNHTRDIRKFNILFNDNITYGFRRNILGLRPISLSLNIIIIVLCGLIIYNMPSYFQSINDIYEKLYIIILVVIIHSAYILMAINKASVIEASEAYGKQLIMSRGSLVPASRTGKKQLSNGAQVV